jgi:hypothetical protein
MLRVLRLVEEAGTRLAVPVQVEMAAEDKGIDRDRAREAEARMRERDAADAARR